MSHQPLRKENDCLNCGTIVQDRYCHHCGQENTVTHQNVWSLIRHFVYDIFHFDGKFFDTLKYLAIRPGFVPKEYVRGRRMGYLDPIRMYLFTSAVFFLVFFSITSPDIVAKPKASHTMSRLERFVYAGHLNKQLAAGTADSALEQQVAYLLDTTYRIRITPNLADSLEDSTFRLQMPDRAYLMEVERIEPEEDFADLSSNWFTRRIIQVRDAYRQKYGDDREMVNSILNTFMHKLPYLLFVSLPFFALILKLLYVRRKQFVYSDHAVFTLYHYIFTFLLLLLYFLVRELAGFSYLGFLNTVGTILLLSGGVYLYLSMKRFYGQGRARTLGKFLLLNVLGIFVLLVLMAIFVAFSIFQI